MSRGDAARFGALDAYDPVVDIDWSAPRDSALWAIPPERVSLSGTAIWARLSDDARRDAARHEAASAFFAVAYLCAMVAGVQVRTVAEEGLNTVDARSALVELGNGTRSTTLFARLARSTEVATYPQPRGSATAIKLLSFLPLGASSHAATLLVEQTVATMYAGVADRSDVEPHVRQAFLIHALDAAPRFAHARAEVSRAAARSGAVSRAYHRVVLAVLAVVTLRLLTSPRAYDHLGARRWRARLATRVPRREIRRQASREVVEFLTSAGLIEGALTQFLWRSAVGRDGIGGSRR